jgi:hypothetical protein
MKNVTPTELPEQVSEAINTVTDGKLKPTLQDAYIATARLAQDWMAKAKQIVVASETDTAAMIEAKVVRLEIRGVRLAAKKRHGELKAPINGYARTVDACERMIREACEPVEAYLLDQEEFIQRKAAREIRERSIKRQGDLNAMGVNACLYLTQCEQFTPEQWTEFMEGQKAAIEAKRLRDAQLEQEAEGRRLEAERLRIENQRLRAQVSVAEVKVKDLTAQAERRPAPAAPLPAPRRRSGAFFYSDVTDAANFVIQQGASYDGSQFVEAVITELRKHVAESQQKEAA